MASLNMGLLRQVSATSLETFARGIMMINLFIMMMMIVMKEMIETMMQKEMIKVMQCDHLMPKVPFFGLLPELCTSSYI